jgi:hypothetical protein
LLVVPRDPAYAGCYPVVGTSQSGFWDSLGNGITTPVPGEAFYGQDAQFSHVQPVYTRSSDGLTVNDEVTGLTWQQSHDNGAYYWAESQNVINSLNEQNYGGYNDWRLPTIEELYSLWNESTGWPSIDESFFTINYSSEEELSHAIFWSSDKYTGLLAGTTEMAFGVNFGTGHIKAYTISTGPKHLVRCVRGNLAYGVNLFQDNGDGTISDLATGLMWTKADNGSGIDWQHAMAFAQTQNNANYLGHNDWRLPNAKELQSLVDYTRSPGATDAANVGPAIGPLFSCTGIVNEAGNADYPYYWTSTSAKANAAGAYCFAWYVAFGRAVDGNGDDLHGAGAVRFDAKAIGGGPPREEERGLNYARLVRNAATGGEDR